ncbi:uncharacterized protein ARMOST_19195 [Armillaria ostoyae]|uniref:Uncharacterized protein n=1 Tax=Armillaria ostoyae TaxID=47428 RepID=A0A284S3U6_ARMOS|nr:uncharacterized protein ARMOST_19195 [Armillaria ostoyae]
MAANAFPYPGESPPASFQYRVPPGPTISDQPMYSVTTVPTVAFIDPPTVLCSKNSDKLGMRDVILANRNDARFWKSLITLDCFGL